VARVSVLRPAAVAARRPDGRAEARRRRADRSAVGQLRARGATIHEYAHGFYHAKLAVIDRDAAIVGSSNLDYWSWNRNAEIDILATDEGSVDLVAGCFDADRAQSREISLREIGLSGWWSRTKDRVAGWFERWL
jgi:cardiolipin synthase